jgi:excinuclease ABC subunit C
MIDEKGKVLYVGKARNLKNRVVNYTHFSKLPNRLKQMVANTKKMEIVNTDSEVEALVLELNFIKTLKPKYNILLNDDKTFPYIAFNTDHEFPRISMIRNVNDKQKKFGPFTGGYDLQATIEILKKSFLIRSCTDSEFSKRDKPCLQYQIKRCSAPCVDYIDKKSYSKSVKQAFKFLEGGQSDVRSDLISTMNKYSEEQNYERAAEYRDRIKALSSITAKQEVSDNIMQNADIIAIIQIAERTIIELFIFRNGFNHGNEHFYPKNTSGLSPSEILTEFMKEHYGPHNLPSEIITNIEIENHQLVEEAYFQYYKQKLKLLFPKLGKKRKLVEFVEKNASFNLEQKLKEKKTNKKYHEKLKEVFNLDKTPNRIDVFDNSHISGTSAVSAMIVSNLTGFDKAQYRKYNIKTANTQDDYDMMREVLTRRYLRAKDEDNFPDLILIDGGKGQASVAAEIFAKLEVKTPFICIAKGKNRNAGKERFCNNFTDYFSLEDQELLYYLQRIRDESHRFVITTHRKKRDKNTLKSDLDKIPGIGGEKKKNLLQYFGSIKNIKAAATKDIAKAPGIGENLAKTIKSYLS